MPMLKAENSVFLEELEYLVQVEVKLPVHPDRTITVDIVWRTIPNNIVCAQLGFQWDIVSGAESGSFRSD